LQRPAEYINCDIEHKILHNHMMSSTTMSNAEILRQVKAFYDPAAGNAPMPASTSTEKMLEMFEATFPPVAEPAASSENSQV
jgi:hypothetical protein